MITFTYNGVDFSGLLDVNDIRGRSITPSEIPTSTVPGMRGAHIGKKRHITRIIEIDVTIKGGSVQGLRDAVNLLSARLDYDEVKPLVFSDEPELTYYAILTGEAIEEDIKSYEQTTITFLCPDPYKYGPTKQASLSGGSGALINVEGTAETPPKFELVATKKATVVMVAEGDGDNYMAIGQDSPVDAPTYEPMSLVMNDTASTLTGWTTANPGEVGGTIAGEVQVTDGNLFRPKSYGTGSGWHGPAIKKSLPETVVDFQMNAFLHLSNGVDARDVGRVEVYLLDVNGRQVAKVAMYDPFDTLRKSIGEARAGDENNNHFLINESGDNGRAWNQFQGVMRIQRRGLQWYAYIAQAGANGKHVARRAAAWLDTGGKHTNAVAQVVVRFAQYGTKRAPDMGLTGVSVHKFNDQAEGVPIIVNPGDIVTFDHAKGTTLTVNGESVKHLKDFGARPFQLKPGQNRITIQPSDALTGTVTWRDAFK